MKVKIAKKQPCYTTVRGGVMPILEIIPFSMTVLGTTMPKSLPLHEATDWLDQAVREGKFTEEDLQNIVFIEDTDP